jgi:tetratricopeptide (TPR) repeat protein
MAIELNPKYAPAWYNRGNVYRRLGQLDKGVADYSRALELDPKFAMAWNNRGLAYNQLGQPDKAVADCLKAVQLGPKVGSYRQNLGVAITAPATGRLPSPPSTSLGNWARVEMPLTGSAWPWPTGNWVTTTRPTRPTSRQFGGWKRTRKPWKKIRRGRKNFAASGRRRRKSWNRRSSNHDCRT